MAEPWYPELVAAMKFPSTLGFAHIGAYHRFRDFTERVVESLGSAGAVWIGDADVGRISEWADGAGDESLAVLILDSLDLRSAKTEEILTNLRPIVTRARESGGRVLFVSARPLGDFSALAGSSILVDAQAVVMRPTSDDHSRTILSRLGVTKPEAISNVVKFASGSRALLEIFAEIDGLEIAGNRKIKLAAEKECQLAKSVFDELGAERCTWLEYWIFECQQSVIDETDIEASLFSILKSAGVVQVSPEGRVRIFPDDHVDVWRDGLSQSLTSVVDAPPSWTAVANELFALERHIRMHLAEHLSKVRGIRWPDVVLCDDRAAVVELARRDAMPGAESLDDIRSPLDWIQMSRLIELAVSESDAHGRFLGLSRIEWERLGTDVLPVRHRVAHMRLVRSRDLEAVRRYRRMIEIRMRVAHRRP